MSIRRLIPSMILLTGLAADVATAAPRAADWEIGPVIRGKNYSVGMPPAPTPNRGGWSFDFPVGSAAAGHVHAVTFRPGSLAGKSQIVVRYRVDAAPGTRFVPQANPDRPATVSLYFQRRGDNWNAKGRYQYYRWYAPSNTVRVLAPGVQEMVVPLNDPWWISVLGKPASSNWRGIADALRDADRIGLVFGAENARGHGVYATQTARFTLLGFDIR